MIVFPETGMRKVAFGFGSSSTFSRILRVPQNKRGGFAIKNIDDKTRTNVACANVSVTDVPRFYFCELSLCAKFHTHSTIPS